MSARYFIPGLVLLLASCGSPEAETQPVASTWVAQGEMIQVTLPGGNVIQAELRQTPQELQSGMMFRPQLPPDNGMLFVFDSLEPRAFWMYRTEVPLDMIWLDENKRIVEIAENAKPCGSIDARDCPTYGGVASSLYCLEMAAGQVIRRGLKVGDQLQF